MNADRPTTVEVSIEGPLKTCRVRGTIGAWNSSEVVRQIDPQGGDRMVVDLTDVSEVDSTGLGALINIYQQVQRRGARLAYTNPSPAVQRLFQTTQLARYLTVLQDPQAIAEFLTAD